MITKITGETPFQVLTNNFSISPSQEGYTLQISADGSNYSDLFAVSAGQTRMVSNVAANSYYRLKGNNSEVTVNWLKTCVTDGGGGDLSNYYTKSETDAEIAQAVSGLATEQYVQDALSGVNMDNYYTSAQTEDAISAATSGKADKVEVTPNTDTFDGHFPLWNADGVITGEADPARRAYLGLNSESYLNFWSQDGNSYSIYAPTTSGNSGEILVSTGSGAPVWSAVTMPDMSEYYTSAQTQTAIDSAITPLEAQIQEISGATPQIDLSDYYTSAQTDAAISAATAGKADAANTTPTDTGFFPRWNAQGIITGRGPAAKTNDITINGVSKSYWGRGNGNPDPFYAPLSAGTAGDILVSTGNGAPVWSAVTIPDASDLNDLAAELSEAERVTAVSINDIRDKMVTSMDVKTIVKMSQAAYDALSTKDATTLYIITGTTI